MASTQDLHEIYESFCSFGSNRNLSSSGGSSLNNGDLAMDGARFSKFCKDCKVIDGKKVTGTDVDILFNKLKAKGARRIDWSGFQQAFSELAQQRFPSKNEHDATVSLLHIVSDKGPIAHTAHYTGSHKQRFDEHGNGRGAAGQDHGSGTRDLSQLVNRDTNFAVPNNTFSGSSHNVSGASNNTSTGAAKKRGQTALVTASSESLEVKAKPVKKTDSHLSNGSLQKSGSRSLSAMDSTSAGSLHGNKSGAGSNGGSHHQSKPSAAGKTSGSGSVFDRLTDSNGYTGSHKARFNADGTGRGLAGRDTAGKGASQDGLAKILRT